MRLTNTASATWHTARGTFKASIMLHPETACMHTLALEHTDAHTNGFSRTHFVKLLQKAVELNESAGADDRTQTAITGEPARFGAPDVAALHGRPPTP